MTSSLINNFLWSPKKANQNEQQLDINSLDAMYRSEGGIVQALLVRYISKDKLNSSLCLDNQAIKVVKDRRLKRTELPLRASFFKSLYHTLFTDRKIIQKSTTKEANTNLLLISARKGTKLSQILLLIITLLFMFMQESNQEPLLTSTKSMPSSRESPFLAPSSISSLNSLNKFKFTSSRHISPKTSFVDDFLTKTSSSATDTKEKDEKLLHNTRLINLRRLLDSYSYLLTGGNNDSINSRQMTQLGSSCLTASECNRSVANSHCNLDSFTCSCLPNHIEHNSTTCLPPSLLGYGCSVDAQCQKKVKNSFCLNKFCACPSEFVAYRKDRCLSASKVNDYCLTDKQCELNDKHSYCKWKIQHVYGLCKCPPNYKHISVEVARPANSAVNNSTTGNVTLFRSSGNLSAGSGIARETLEISTRCAPRLGDVCFEHSECELATPNSQCKEAPDNLKISWPTSRASSSKRCQCSENFVESRNKISCEPALLSGTTPALIEHSLPPSTKNLTPKSTTPASVLTMLSGSNMNAKNHYELVTTFSESPPISTVAPMKTMPEYSTTTLAPKLNTSNAQAIDIKENQSVGQSESSKLNNNRLKLSSLGKACKSKTECQLRDPHSDCINGICECKKVTAKCSAKSTGCHKDTFQCRNGQCISWYFVCDQFKNCDDGSDEDECLANSCPSQAFQCDNGNCVARGKICNGKWDCPDGSDERLCFVNIKQKEATKIATNVSDNLHSSNSKEQQHQQFSNSKPTEQNKCDSRAFTCANGQCLPAYVFCNAVEDCADGSDEQTHFCEANSHRRWSFSEQLSNEVFFAPSLQNINVTSSVNLKSQSNIASPSNSNITSASPLASINSTNQDSPLLKTDRNSINKMLAALNAAQLMNNNLNRNRASRLFQDSTDEIFGQRRRADTRGRDNRVALTPSSFNQQDDQQCPRGGFTCQNGKCRSSAILCSGIDGCGDNSDENRCEVCQCETP